MRKVLCMLLALCVCAVMVIPSMATEKPQPNKENNLLPLGTPWKTDASQTGWLAAAEDSDEEVIEEMHSVDAMSSVDYPLMISDTNEDTFEAWENFLKTANEFEKTQDQNAE